MNGDTKIPARMNGDAKVPASIGPARLAGALRYSIAGFRHAARQEAAFQQELLLALILLPAAVMLPVPVLERLVLALSMLFVMVVELLNTAIESTVDRISAERHPLAGQAKDMGSAAVFIAVTMSVACWVVIAGPVIAGWLASATR